MSSAQLGPLAGAGPSAIADRTKTCLHTFNTILGLITSGQDAQDVVNDNLSRFRIWAGNIGAYHVDSKSADYRVRDAPEIKDRIIELLDELEETNDEVRAIVSGEREDAALVDRDEHADDDDDDPTTELSELCLAAGDTISSLLKVAALLRKATGRDRYAKAAAAVDDPFLESFDIKHVAEKFPKLDRMPWLRDRLGKANVQRRQYLRYARKHHERLAHEPEGSAQPAPAMTPARERPELANIPESRPRTIMSSRPTLAPTDASTLRVDLLPPIQDTHVELLDETLSQATSVVTSKAHHHENGELDVIRLSELSKNGDPFDSDAVQAIVDAGSRPVAEIPANACPMCDEWELKLKESANEMEIPSENVLTVSVHDFERHLSQHLEQLALFAIPPALERLVESESQADAKDVSVKPTVETLQQWRELTWQQPDVPTIEVKDWDAANPDEASRALIVDGDDPTYPRASHTSENSERLRSISWGEDKTHIYDVRTPDSFEDRGPEPDSETVEFFRQPISESVHDTSGNVSEPQRTAPPTIAVKDWDAPDEDEFDPDFFKARKSEGSGNIVQADFYSVDTPAPLYAEPGPQSQGFHRQSFFDSVDDTSGISSQLQGTAAPTIEVQDWDASISGEALDPLVAEESPEVADDARDLKSSAESGDAAKLTATLWEDEGTLCFQVSRHGIIVARREDNNMINGSKLLSYAGLSRDRRDGRLKSEELQHVVKTGPLHLKGVWIPFERALELANEHGITDRLHPLFVPDIGALLFPAQNHGIEASLHQPAEHQSHRVNDYQLQLKLLEQQNKKRLGAARDEKERNYDVYGLTQLARACRAGDLELVKEWSRKDPEQIELSDHEGNMPLHYAVANSDGAMVDYLLDQESGLDWRSVNGDTPLIIAVKNGHLEITRRLLRAGADPRLRNRQGRQAQDFVPEGHVHADEIKAALQGAVLQMNSPDPTPGEDWLLQAEFKLAETYLDQNNTSEAVRLAGLVVDRRASLLRNEDRALIAAKLLLADALSANREFDKAIALLDGMYSHDTLGREPDMDDLSRARTMLRLGQAYHAMGRTADAIELLHGATSSLHPLLGEHDPETLASSHELARAYRTSGQFEEALDRLEIIIQAEQDARGPDSHRGIKAKYDRAQVLVGMGHVDEAIPVLQEVLSAQSRVYGPEHPCLIATLDKLAKAYHAEGQEDKVQEVRQLMDNIQATRSPDPNPIARPATAALDSGVESELRQESSLLHPLGPLLDDYNDKVGTMRLLQNKFDGLQFEYKAARDERIGQRHIGYKLEEDDEEFEAKFGERISDAEAATQAAAVAVEDARIACVDAGFDVHPVIAPSDLGPQSVEDGLRFKSQQSTRIQAEGSGTTSLGSTIESAGTEGNASRAEESRAVLLNASQTAIPVTESHNVESKESSNVKGILKKPTEALPENADAEAKNVEIAKRPKKDIPPGARWTKIERRLVTPEVLEEAGEHFEERMDFLIVMRVLTKEEIQALTDRTREVRASWGGFEMEKDAGGPGEDGK
ncbi:hypothetical protein PRZ48_006832 [Zasmidium cellare]|uniref:HTH APSES-type domain-containing protein n=1 Tax=Zasmidium cellare TaxID=395010 RepID=A0ABR0EIF3_ZASCE|nr:hypothetical protein PRZ48_006832 [Zasmidium cellare]